MKSTRVLAAGFLLAVSATLAVAPIDLASAQVVGDSEFTLDPGVPVAWEPLTISVEVSNCDPDVPGFGVRVEIDQTSSDAITYAEVVSNSFEIVDGTGMGEVVIPTAYPGSWFVSIEGCGGDGVFHDYEFEVAAPSDFTLTASPQSTLKEDQPFAIDLAGSGCPSDSVRWLVGRHTGFGLGAFVAGLAQPVDGTWAATASGTISFDTDEWIFPHGGAVYAAATCEVDGFMVFYPDVRLPFEAAPEVVVVTPQYTG